MRYVKTALAVAIIALAGCKEEAALNADEHSHGPVEDGVVLKTHQQKVSYLAALEFADKYHSQGVPLDANAVAAAVRDIMAGAELRMGEDEIQKTFERFREDQLKRQQELAAMQADATAALEAQFDQLSQDNLKAGEAFLAENAAKEGVQTTDSGLQYKVLQAGEGEVPTATDTVSVHYRGKLLDGTEFDSSYKRDVPATLKVNEGLPAWTEALQMMPAGSKWELYVPASLGYGPGGIEGVGPNATLIYELELLEIVPTE